MSIFIVKLQIFETRIINSKIIIKMEKNSPLLINTYYSEFCTCKSNFIRSVNSYEYLSTDNQHFESLLFYGSLNLWDINIIHGIRVEIIQIKLWKFA